MPPPKAIEISNYAAVTADEKDDDNNDDKDFDLYYKRNPG